MTAARDAFLSGERPEDVVLFLSENHVSNIDALAEYGQRVDDGMVLVLDGETGRSVFGKATGKSAMDFAAEAMKTEGGIEPDLTGGTCPNSDETSDDPHETRFVFSFVEEQTDAVDGLVAEGDVVFAYALCTCGTAYSDRWHVGSR